MSRLSIVIFGATGFTGKHAVFEMVRLSKEYPQLTWGVAGRSLSKLEALLQEVSKKTGEDQSHVKTLVADVSDEKSLKDMCSQAAVVANCCGPYRLYGEPVVRAAIEANTHHVDVTGEPQFIETMQLKYDEQAREAGVYVISACGYDSIPNDMGTVYLQQNFGGTLNSIESYMSTYVPPEYEKLARQHGAIHYGTWTSLVYSLAHYGELKPLRKKLYPERLPEFKPKLQKRSVIHSREGEGRGGYCLPFPGSDNSIVYRTQRRLHEELHQRPAQFRAYATVASLSQAVLLMLGAVLLYGMSQVGFLRRLLLDYPRFFTLGLVSHEGPPQELMEHTKYSVTLYGEGWEGEDTDGPPNKRVVAKVSGVNPGYGATVTALLYSAITILTEKDKIPYKGGVLTTGAAFRNTNLVKNLSQNNMKFEIIDTANI